MSQRAIWPARDNQYVALVEEFAEEHHGAGTCIVSAAVEAELIDFDAEEAAEYLESLGVKDSGVSLLIRATYDLLGRPPILLQASRSARLDIQKWHESTTVCRRHSYRL